jgi:hypothetical protein
MFGRVGRVLLSQVTLCRLEARLEAYTHGQLSAADGQTDLQHRWKQRKHYPVQVKP